MEITLTPELERMVRRGMASGRYATPEDLVEDALVFWNERTAGTNERTSNDDIAHRRYVQELNDAVREAQDEVRRGEYKDYDAAELDCLFEDIKRKGRESVAAGGKEQP